eukprot:CAMPEP_0172817586 /NCGR_PEP_ID=MMETSP1075-20121228/13309_1 /TAXON_ID=2916 /ORGANISM="Ceratium fusus, Strain PA161109" /LENGTH=35 /DNA_ID= /DNA_START= /DNA_END= /DNA_ORIENTATION=
MAVSFGCKAQDLGTSVQHVQLHTHAKYAAVSSNCG